MATWFRFFRDTVSVNRYYDSMESPTDRLTILDHVLSAFIQCAVEPLVCGWKGHALEADYADPENGTEDIYCRRCGWQHTARF